VVAITLSLLCLWNIPSGRIHFDDFNTYLIGTVSNKKKMSVAQDKVGPISNSRRPLKKFPENFLNLLVGFISTQKQICPSFLPIIRQTNPPTTCRQLP